MQGKVDDLVQDPPDPSPSLPKDRCSAPMQVVIPFQPLLEQVAQCLRMSSPSYRYEDEPSHSVYVSVRPESESVSYIYSGGASSSTEESCENAARQAVLDIMTKYRVTVMDFTHSKLEKMNRIAGLYTLKRLELEALLKGHRNIPLNEEVSPPRLRVPKIVSLDFVSILAQLTTKFEVHCTTLMTIRHGRERFTAWISVALPGVTYVQKEFVSACFKFPELAKNDVAQKVIEYVAPLLNIEIIDANYNTPATNLATFKCAMAQESFFALQERALGIKANFNSQILLLEEAPTTPRGLMFQIPQRDCPPPPPKKMKLCATCEHKAHVKPTRKRRPQYFKVSEDLEAMCDRFKKA